MSQVIKAERAQGEGKCKDRSWGDEGRGRGHSLSSLDTSCPCISTKIQDWAVGGRRTQGSACVTRIQPPQTQDPGHSSAPQSS